MRIFSLNTLKNAANNVTQSLAAGVIAKLVSGQRKAQVNPSPVSSIVESTHSHKTEVTRLVKRTIKHPSGESQPQPVFISQGYLLAERFRKSPLPAHKTKGLNIGHQNRKSTDLRNISVFPLTGERVIKVEDAHAVKLSPLSRTEEIRLRKGLRTIRMRSQQSISTRDLDQSADNLTQYLSSRDPLFDIREILSVREKINTMMDYQGLLPELQRQAVLNYCRVLKDLCEGALSTLHEQRKQGLPAFLPGGSYFRAVSIRYKIHPDEVADIVGADTLDDYRNRQKMKVTNQQIPCTSDFHQALSQEMEDFFKFVANKHQTRVSPQEKATTLAAKLSELYHPAPASTHSMVEHRNSDMTLKALKRTGVKNKWTIFDSGKPTAMLACEKADLHKGIVQHLIDQWKRQHALIDTQLQKLTIEFGEVLDSSLDSIECSKVLSALVLRQRALEDLHKRVEFPSLPLIQLNSTDDQVDDSSYFKTQDINSRDLQLRLTAPNPQTVLTTDNVLLEKKPFAGDIEKLKEFKETMTTLLQDCCLLESPQSSSLRFSEEDKSKLARISSQLKTAIAEQAYPKATEARTQTLHYLRVQEAVLERYLKNQLKTHSQASSHR